VHLWEVRGGTDERSPTSYSAFVEWRSRAKSFRDLEDDDPGNFMVGVGDDARMLPPPELGDAVDRALNRARTSGAEFTT
jgi:hypothetical protein